VEFDRARGDSAILHTWRERHDRQAGFRRKTGHRKGDPSRTDVTAQAATAHSSRPTRHNQMEGATCKRYWTALQVKRLPSELCICKPSLVFLRRWNREIALCQQFTQRIPPLRARIDYQHPARYDTPTEAVACRCSLSRSTMGTASITEPPTARSVIMCVGNS
jgi:hypothetical protein